MGANCCRSNSLPNYKIYLNRDDDIYELSCVPRTYDLLLQSIVAITTDIDRSYYAVVSYRGEKGEVMNLPINDDRSYKIVLKRCRFQDITLNVRLESYENLFKLKLGKITEEDYDSVLDTWQQTLSTLAEPIQFFLESQQKLLKYTVKHCCRLENVSLEAAVLVVLLELGLSARGNFESIGLALCKDAPYIVVNSSVLLPGGIEAIRLWNDLIYGLQNFSPRVDELFDAYNNLLQKTRDGTAVYGDKVKSEEYRQLIANLNSLVPLIPCIESLKKRSEFIQGQLESTFTVMQHERKQQSLKLLYQVIYSSALRTSSEVLELFKLQRRAFD
mmetsp:Transcript_26092/g.46345  ORF Transcript_26092/g.46345 Transcript_26092/m.46345 type:complete len:330 (+) Transcript_26092:4567-5556(+)